MNTLLRGCVLALIVLTYPAATGQNRGDRLIQKETPEESKDFLRGKVRNENHISVRKRNQSPLKSPGLSLQALLSKEKAILRVLHDKGCPTIEDTIFNITVFTADLRLAGTSSQVYINLYGMMYGLEQSTEKIHLTNNDTNEFITGGFRVHLLAGATISAERRIGCIDSVDSFVVKTKFVGLIERITIEHDNTGFFPDWHLNKVVVEDLKIGRIQTYMCDCEMSGYENQVTLPPI